MAAMEGAAALACDDEVPAPRGPRAVASARRIGARGGGPVEAEDECDEGPPCFDHERLAFDGDDRAALPRGLQGTRLRGLLDAGEARTLLERTKGCDFAATDDSVDERPAYECVVFDRGRVVEEELWALARCAVDRAAPALRRTFGCDTTTLAPSQCLLRRYERGERREHPPHFDAHAMVTLVVAVSPRGDYDGGYYALPDHDAPRRFVDLEAGDGFAHAWDLRHGVSVSRGARVSLVCWFAPEERLRDHSHGPGPWHVAAAQRGDADALYALACAAKRQADLSVGETERAERDWVAERALAMAADAGSPEAMELLGAARIAKGDAVAGLASLRDAAARGYPRAMRHLASALLSNGGDDGRGAALRWLRRAAKRHDADAMYDLWVVDPTGRFAAAWLRRAALLGHPDASAAVAAAARRAAS